MKQQKGSGHVVNPGFLAYLQACGMCVKTIFTLAIMIYGILVFIVLSCFCSIGCFTPGFSPIKSLSFVFQGLFNGLVPSVIDCEHNLDSLVLHEEKQASKTPWPISPV